MRSRALSPACRGCACAAVRQAEGGPAHDALPPRSYYYVKSYAEGSGVIHLAAGIV